MLSVATFAVVISVAFTQTLPSNILPIDMKTDAPFTPPWYCHQLQCPVFSLLDHNNDFEVRHYEPSVWVGTTVSNVDLGSYKSRTLFQKLFHYIDHGNNENKKIPMTAPVVTQVVPASGGNGNVTMYFMIPFDLQGNPPKPNDTDVFIANAPEFTAYIKSYSGFNLFHQSDNKLAELKQQLGTSHNYDNNSYYTAGYDSPFSFSNRHNEVWLIAKDVGSPENSIVGRR